MPLGEKGRDDATPRPTASSAACSSSTASGGSRATTRGSRACGPRKASLEYAWRYWDRDRDGVMEGLQHNTYDIEFWGPNTMMGSFYLGALRAGERDRPAPRATRASADRYRGSFERGRAWTDANLWNGEYYEQRVRARTRAADP